MLLFHFYLFLCHFDNNFLIHIVPLYLYFQLILNTIQVLLFYFYLLYFLHNNSLNHFVPLHFHFQLTLKENLQEYYHYKNPLLMMMNQGSNIDSSSSAEDSYSDSILVNFLLKSAENENAMAQNDLGNYYAKNIKDKNKIKALESYLESAENKDKVAQYELGNCYQNGIGTDKNETKAFEWYLKSAENGNVTGQNNLANCYENGIGTVKNETKAFEWYLKSAN